MDIKRETRFNGGYKLEADTKTGDSNWRSSVGSQKPNISKLPWSDTYYKILNPMGVCILSIGIFNTQERGVWIQEMLQTIPKNRKSTITQIRVPEMLTNKLP